MLDRPQLRGKNPRGGLEQRRYIQAVSAEAHPVFPQRGAGGLVERLDFVGDLVTLQHAERFDELKRHPARNSGHVLGAGEPKQRPEQFFDVDLEP